MLHTIQEAATNFCTHQIGTSCEIGSANTPKKALIAYIDIFAHDKSTYRVYIIPDNNFIQRVSKIFLQEDESDEETLKDMTLETANLIVGSAKVLAEEAGITYTIGTPHFEKIGTFDFDYDELRAMHIDNDVLTIASKELNV